jgi:hypothetical protein
VFQGSRTLSYTQLRPEPQTLWALSVSSTRYVRFR